MAMQNVLAALAVSDLDASVSWYTKVLGRGPTEIPMKGLVEWEFPGGGWLQLYEKAAKAGNGSITITEDDLATRVASLQTAKIRIDSEISSGKTSIAIVEDPDGNQIVFSMKV